MPQRALRACGYPGCPNLVRDVRYCEQHARQEQQRYDERRGSSSTRGYGSRWRRLRMMYLRSNPLCEDPFNVHDGRLVRATDVDHILARAAGGDDSIDNLQALCKECHSRKTAVVDGRWGKND